MPAVGLVRKLIIFAAVDGLVLQAHGNGQRHNNNNGNNNESSFVRIEYKTNKISSGASSVSDQIEGKNLKDVVGLEAYGLVGLLSVATCSFLISITQRQQVAQIHGKPIYAVTNVALIPISSQADAARAISQARESVLQGDSGPGETASEDDDDMPDSSDTDGSDTDVSSMPASPSRGTSRSRRSGVGSIAEDVIGKKVRFGRFAATWLSRKALGLSGLRAAGAQDTDVLPGNNEKDTTTSTTLTSARVDASGVKEEEEDAEASHLPEVHDCSLVLDERPEASTSPGETVELLPKLLRYTKLIFASQNFFFAYDYDLTRPVGSIPDSLNCHIPLYKVVDPLYFWNRHLMAPLVEAGMHSLVLPLMQGSVGQREFSVPAPEQQSTETGGNEEEGSKGHIPSEEKESKAVKPGDNKRDFLLTLISRRSVKRPGLRYLRRGVDDDGNTANTVETEQVLSAPDWDPTQNIYSFLQIRGSIPLYFSQSPYAFKPVPVLHHSTETNQLAFDRHFRELGRRYGKIQAVSLIDKQAGELKLGEQYEKYAQRLNESGGIDGTRLNLEWFDFHEECRGMKFENVRRLVDTLEQTLDDYGDTIVHDKTIVRRQAGIVRTNCMDCLDRTGVAQCAFGQWALEKELKSEGITVDLQNDLSTQWFNILWADNGDAISKQYSSTAALKGDYTRTRKRNYRGALNDLGLTLSRYYNNTVNDYFSQACIDYLLGNVSTQVFKEFELEMQSVDPGISVQKLRQNAIDTSCQIVISEQSEEFLGGWTMLTPRQPNTLRSLPLEESVLLLTDAAVYNCRFDWNTDKVVSFERIDIRSISHINYGTYITSILTEAQMDEKTNVGLVIVHSDGDENLLRVNTRSLRSNVNLKALDAGDDNNKNNNASGPSSSGNIDNTTTNNNDEWDIYSWFKTGTGTKRSTSPFIAFKALPLSNSVMSKNRNSDGGVVANVSELDFVRSICEEIERAIMAVVAGEGERHVERPSVIEQADIISLEDAKKRTGYLEHLVYDLKKLVWA